MMPPRGSDLSWQAQKSSEHASHNLEGLATSQAACNSPYGQLQKPSHQAFELLGPLGQIYDAAVQAVWPAAGCIDDSCMWISSFSQLRVRLTKLVAKTEGPFGPMSGRP
jgi:hypothetical protein